MAGRRGPTTPAWMEREIRSIAVFLQGLQPAKPYPDYREVQKELTDYLKTTKRVPKEHPDYEEEPSLYDRNYRAPGRTKIEQITKNIKYPTGGDDQPWSLGIHTVSGLSDDCVGACMDVWRYTLTLPFNAPFTVRMARWVSKLRWVVAPWDALGIGARDGHPTPEQIEKLHQTAVLYAAHELHAEAVNDQRGMRSPILDVKLAISQKEQNVALKLGLMDEWSARDDSVNIPEEFLRYAPELFDVMRKQGALQRGAVDITTEKSVFDMILDSTFGKDAPPNPHRLLRHQALGMWMMTVKIATRSPRWEQLPMAGKHLVQKALLTDLAEAHGRGEMDSWTPNIDQAFEQAEAQYA